MYRGSVCGKGEIIIFQHRNMCSKKWRAFFIFDDPVLYYDLHGWIELWFIYRILLWLGTAADAATADTCTYVYYQIRSQHCKYLTKVIMFRVDKVQIKIQKKATSKIDSSFLFVNNCSFCCFLFFLRLVGNSLCQTWNFAMARVIMYTIEIQIVNIENDTQIECCGLFGNAC